MKDNVNEQERVSDNQETLLIQSQQKKGSFSDMRALPKFMLQYIDKISNDVIVVSDLFGRLLFISENVKSVLGYTASDMIGSNWYDKLLTEDVTYIQRNFFHNAKTKQRFSINIRNIQGKYVWFSGSIIKVQDEQSGTSYYLAALQDITHKKEAEAMMVRSEKMSVAGQLAAGIAHEIRNPLTSMKGFLQLLQAGVGRKEEYCKIMIDEIDKIETITSELLFISKPLTDNKKDELVDQMVEDVVVLLRPQARLDDIELKWGQRINQSIYCDKTQIKQVLINLVKNAIEAMSEPGIIEIEQEEIHDYIIIRVIDEGSGIPEEVIHKLGEPFFTTKQTGTGLGLMITKQILTHHDGTMEVFQNSKKGSTFQIRLPKSK